MLRWPCSTTRHWSFDVDDPEYGESQPVSALDYEALLAEGDRITPGNGPDNEWDAIALNYTSGTTGNPGAWCITIAARI